MTLKFSLLEKAAHLLRNNQLVVIPTETVYGLAANAHSDIAVTKIYALKKRPNFNPLIIHCKDMNMVQEIATLNENALKLALAFWPGPLTFVVPLNKSTLISKLATAGLDTVALRIPSHPLALKILNLANIPLAAPSANLSETISPTIADHVEKSLSIDHKDLPLIINGGPCDVGLESTIIDLSEEPTLLRPGKITHEAIERVIGMIIRPLSQDKLIKAPGQMKRHYAPSIPLYMNAQKVTSKQALLAFGPSPLFGAKETLNLSVKGDLNEAAANLFAMLHLLDRPNVNSIAVMPIPNVSIGIAINDRLSRAAVNKEI